MITFFSNYINDHQIPFCNAMYEKTNGNFCFVGTIPMGDFRKKLGYVDKSTELDYVLNAYDSEENYQKALKLGGESDVVIIGNASDEFIKERLKNNKLTFRVSERFFKRGRWRILDPRVFICHYKHDFKYRNKPLYMLCASAYTTSDCKFILSYPNKTYKWGYFPPVKKYDDVDNIIKSKDKNSILWVARLIKLKHPEMPIKIARRLKKEGYDFTLNMIGDGVKRENTEKFIKKYNLQDRVKILGSMPPEEVREYMEKSEIFLFTSDRNEGWGAVLNESMNSACAVVANKAIGSVPYLIKDGENGLIYNGKVSDLYKKVKLLLDNEQKREVFGANAYKTLTDTWNADNAVDRLLNLIDNIKENKGSPYKDGPCSRG